MEEKLALSVAEASRELGICLKSMYNLTKQAGFPALKIGNRTIIPRDGLREWIHRQTENGGTRV